MTSSLAQTAALSTAEAPKDAMPSQPTRSCSCRPIRVAMLLNNPCIADSRVIKAAESLAEAGYDVTVFCRAAPNAGPSVAHNGVTYRRIAIPAYRLRRLIDFLMQQSLLGTVVRGQRRIGRVLTVLIVSPFLILAIPFVRRYVGGGDSKRKGSASRALDFGRACTRSLRNTGARICRMWRRTIRFTGVHAKDLADHVRRHLRDTLTAMDRALPAITLLDAFQRIVHRVGNIICGIMRITSHARMRVQFVLVQVASFAVRGVRFGFRVLRRLPRRLWRTVRQRTRQTGQWLGRTRPFNKWAVELLQPICSYNVFRLTMRDPVTCWHPDVIHAHDLVTLPAAVDIAKRIDAQVVYDAHEFATLEIENEFRLATLYKKYTERRLIKQISGMITVSDGFSRIFSELYRIEPPVVIYNTPRFDPHDAMDRDVRSDLGFDASVPLGVYIGGLNPRRALRQLVESLAYAPEMHIAKIGARNPRYEAMIEEAAAEFGVRDRLHLLDDVPPDQIIHYVRTGDFGIVTRIKFSLQQDYSMPNKLFESVFGGLPIIAGDVREIRDFLDRFEVGVLMNSLNPKDIARAMREAYARREELRPTPQKRQAIAAEFGWPAQQRKMLALYQRVTAERSTAPE